MGNKRNDRGDYESVKKIGEEKNIDEKIIHLLEKQKKDLVVRTLQKHEEIKNEKIFTDKIIANLSDILIILDSRMKIIKVNQEFTRCLGFDPLKSKRLNLKRLIPPEGFQKLNQRILSGEFKNYETELVASDGRKFLASINGSIIDGGKESKKMYILVARDKTEVYEMMSRVRESQMQLIHSGRLASLGEMAAGIAHELTQPLNAILLFARNSLKSLSDNGIRNNIVEDNMTFIIDRVKKASSIIRSLKSFARKTEDEKILFDLNLLIEDILKFLDAQFRLSDIEVELRLDNTIDHVMAHNVRLEQVFLNIIQNALQAMNKTERPVLGIRTWAERALVPGDLIKRNYVVVSISDNGEGMAPEILERIFDPFFTTREVGSGMGLGLSIVDRIIREHAGHIQVESSKERGSCFRIYLPSVERKRDDGE